jgi:hypothetical protein
MTVAIPNTTSPRIYQGRQQMLAEALRRSAEAQPQDIGGQVGEALNRVGTSFLMGSNEREAEAERASANNAARQFLAARLSGQPVGPEALDALGSEWVDPGFQQLIGGLVSDQLSPGDDTELVQAVGPDGNMTWVPKAQAAGMQSALPDANWQIEKVREGGEDVTYRINVATGERQEIGRGAAFAAQQDGGPKTSLVPFYTQDANGNVQMWQPTASGVPVQVQLPDGIQPTKPLSFQDLGTSVVGINPLGGQPQVSMPKDVAGAASQTAQGKGQGEAAVNLPMVRENARVIRDTIGRIKNHPGRVAATGGSSVLNPVAIPGSERADFLAQARQLQGQAFLQAYESLKGGGQITEIEGSKAEAAKVALDTAQSEEQYLQALDIFAREVDALVSLAEQKAGSAPSPMAPTGAPTNPQADPRVVSTLPEGFQ